MIRKIGLVAFSTAAVLTLSACPGGNGSPGYGNGNNTGNNPGNSDLSFYDFQVHRNRQVIVNDLAIIKEKLQLHVFFQPFGILTEDGRIHIWLFIGVGVHEYIKLTIIV
jgi:hypothetical protein